MSADLEAALTSSGPLRLERVQAAVRAGAFKGPSLVNEHVRAMTDAVKRESPAAARTLALRKLEKALALRFR
jgi:hypothetical protein